MSRAEIFIYTRSGLLLQSRNKKVAHEIINNSYRERFCKHPLTKCLCVGLP